MLKLIDSGSESMDGEPSENLTPSDGLTLEERAAWLLRRKTRGAPRARNHSHPLHCIIGQHLWHNFIVNSAKQTMDEIARSLAQRQAVTTVPRDAFYNRPEDYPGPAVDYSKGYETFEVRDSAVVYKVPPLDVFGLDWRLGEGPPHAALSIARMGTALVGERIELINFQGKTGSWVKYDVLNFDADGRFISKLRKGGGAHYRATVGGTYTVRRVGGERDELVDMSIEQVRLPNPAPSTQKNFDDSIRRIWKLVFDLQELMPYGDWETRHRAQELMLSAYFEVNDPDSLPISSWNWRPSGPDFMAPFFWRGPLDRATKTYLLMCYSLDTTPFQRGTFVPASRWMKWTGAFAIFMYFDSECRRLVQAEAPPRELNACCPCCGSMATLRVHHTSFSSIGGYVCWHCDKKFAILDICGRPS